MERKEGRDDDSDRTADTFGLSGKKEKGADREKIADVGAKTAAKIPSQMEEGFLLKCHLNRVRDTTWRP